MPCVSLADWILSQPTQLNGLTGREMDGGDDSGREKYKDIKQDDWWCEENPISRNIISERVRR